MGWVLALLLQELNIMRKFVTAAATALTLGVLSISTPALADQNSGYTGYHGPQGNYQQHQAPGYGAPGHPGWGYDAPRGRDRDDGFRRGDRQFDWNRHEGNFDRWERGWNRGDREFMHHGRALSPRQLVRRVEAQGFYGVRGLREARWGKGYRAFAYTFRGRPVMLRINPYNGRVMDVRFI
jgi:hypothetical protein